MQIYSIKKCNTLLCLFLLSTSLVKNAAEMALAQFTLQRVNKHVTSVHFYTLLSHNRTNLCLQTNLDKVTCVHIRIYQYTYM